MTSSFKELMLTAPGNAIDTHVRSMVTTWDDPPTSIQILKVLDECIHHASASGFVVAALQGMLENTLKTEGKSLEDILPEATWRHQ